MSEISWRVARGLVVRGVLVVWLVVAALLSVGSTASAADMCRGVTAGRAVR